MRKSNIVWWISAFGIAALRWTEHITFWQAFGLLILSAVVLGAYHGLTGD